MIEIRPPVDGARVLNDDGIRKLALSSPVVEAARRALAICELVIGALPPETARKAWVLLGCWVDEIGGASGGKEEEG